MVMVWLTIWIAVMAIVLLWAAASLHWENRELKQAIATLKHPSRQYWGCMCGAITLSNHSELADGKGMTHRTHDRCIPDLEAIS